MPLVNPMAPFAPHRRVLVLGSNSRIGRLLARVWGNGTHYGVLPHWQHRPLQASFPAEPNVNTTEISLLNNEMKLASLASGMDAMLVLAGVTPSSKTSNPDYKLNVILAQAALSAAVRANVKRVFLISTAAVYGTGSGWIESMLTRPSSSYGTSKLAMEQMAKAYEGVTVLRLGNVAGADQLLGPGRRDVILDVFADGRSPKRSYIGPTAMGRVLAELICSRDPLPNCINVAAPEPVDMAELLKAADIRFSTRPAPPDLPASLTLDTSLLQSLTSLHAKDAHPQNIVSDWLSITGGRPL